MKQSEEVNSLTTRSNNHYILKTRSETRGKKIKTMSLPRIKFHSSGLDVAPSTFWFVGEDVDTDFKYLPVCNIMLEETAKRRIVGRMKALSIFFIRD